MPSLPIFKSANGNLIYDALLGRPEVELVTEIRERSYICRVDNKVFSVKGEISVLNNPSSKLISSDKIKTKKALSLSDIPTADYIGIYFSEESEGLDVRGMIVDFLLKHEVIVMKPSNGKMSNDIFMNVDNIDDALSAYTSIKQRSDERRYSGVILEQKVEGDLYRFTYIGNEFVAVSKRDFLHVIGDGVSSIAELLTPVNDYYQNKRKQSTKRIIDVNDTESQEVLSRQGFVPTSVPEPGQKVVFTNIPDPGFITNVFSGVNPKIFKILGKYCESIGLEYAGFDVMSKDVSSETFFVIEVNSNPDIDLHHFPDSGESVDVANKYVSAVIKKVKSRWTIY